MRINFDVRPKILGRIFYGSLLWLGTKSDVRQWFLDPEGEGLLIRGRGDLDITEA